MVCKFHINSIHFENVAFWKPCLQYMKQMGDRFLPCVTLSVFDFHCHKQHVYVCMHMYECSAVVDIDSILLLSPLVALWLHLMLSWSSTNNDIQLVDTLLYRFHMLYVWCSNKVPNFQLIHQHFITLCLRCLYLCV